MVSRAIGQAMMSANDRRLATKKLFEEAPYYPKYRKYKESLTNIFRNRELHVIFNTKLRVEHEGTWYVIHHVKSGMITEKTTEEDILEEFLSSIYLSERFRQIDPTLRNLDGDLLFPKDKLQISEKERLNL